jgi:hypothetical protein
MISFGAALLQILTAKKSGTTFARNSKKRDIRYLLDVHYCACYIQWYLICTATRTQVNSARTPSLSSAKYDHALGKPLTSALHTKTRAILSSLPATPPPLSPMMKPSIEAITLDLTHGDNAQREQLILFAYVPYIRLSSLS